MRELHPLHAIRLSTKKRAERLAQSGVDHPGEAGRGASAADQAAPVVRIARGVAFDGGSAGLQIHHVGEVSIAFGGVEAALYYGTAVTFVLCGVSGRVRVLKEIRLGSLSKVCQNFVFPLKWQGRQQGRECVERQQRREWEGPGRCARGSVRRRSVPRWRSQN